MNKKTMKEDIQKSKKIARQVENWDMFAKLAPTIFLIVCFILLITEAVAFETVFSIGMILFALTAVTWWFWTIFSIRFLVKTLNRASNGLIEVTNDLSKARKELKDYLDEESNSSKRD
jgi:MFS superfamily sulfate permease-like transporter